MPGWHGCFLKCHGRTKLKVLKCCTPPHRNFPTCYFFNKSGSRNKAYSVKHKIYCTNILPLSVPHILLVHVWPLFQSNCSQTCQTMTSGIPSTPADLGGPCDWCPFSMLCLFLWLSGGPESVVTSTSDIDEWAGVRPACWARCLAWTWTTVLWFSETP